MADTDLSDFFILAAGILWQRGTSGTREGYKRTGYVSLADRDLCHQSSWQQAIWTALQCWVTCGAGTNGNPTYGRDRSQSSLNLTAQHFEPAWSLSYQRGGTMERFEILIIVISHLDTLTTDTAVVPHFFDGVYFGWQLKHFDSIKEDADLDIHHLARWVFLSEPFTWSAFVIWMVSIWEANWHNRKSPSSLLLQPVNRQKNIGKDIQKPQVEIRESEYFAALSSLV